MNKTGVARMFTQRYYELRTPYAGVYSKEYLYFIYTRIALFRDPDALWFLRENSWLAEGRRELAIKIETPEYREKLVEKMKSLGVLYSRNPRDIFFNRSNPRLSARFLSGLKQYSSSKDRYGYYQKTTQNRNQGRAAGRCVACS